MNIVDIALMLDVQNIENLSKKTLNNIVAFKIKKLTLYASLNKEELCRLHNLIPAEKAALIHL